MERDRPQYDSPAVFVIAQQCSSATFFSLRYHSRKEKLGAIFKNLIFLFFYFLINFAKS
jgi:hypothetical protein